MSATQKELILAEIKAAVGAISGVGGVIDVDAAALQQGGRSDSWVQAIRKLIADTAAGGKFAVEMDVSPSQTLYGDEAGSRALSGVDVWDFEVFFLIHLPEKLPLGPGDTLLTPVQVAEEFCAAIYLIAGAGVPLTGQTQCGLWLHAAGDGQPLAQFTKVDGMGGVALSDIATRVTYFRMTVRHRTLRGQAGVRG